MPVPWNLEMLVFEERVKPEYPPGEKPFGPEQRTNDKLNQHMAPCGPGIEPGTHW